MSDATTCEVPMWPEGPECIRQAGHEGAHHSLSDNIQWTYTACWESWQHDGLEYHCIAPQGHDGGHKGG